MCLYDTVGVLKYTERIYSSQCSSLRRSQNVVYYELPSVLWRCWLGDRKGIRPIKKTVVGCWHGYLSGVRCKVAYGPADATATHCHCLLLHINPDWFCLLGPAHPGSPDKGPLNRCVCVCMSISIVMWCCSRAGRWWIRQEVGQHGK